MSIISIASRSGWYPDFISPIADIINSIPLCNFILDWGTGPGTLPSMLIANNSDLKAVGLDIDIQAIESAQKHHSHSNISFLYHKEGVPLNFNDKFFDVVTFCSVLFLVPEGSRKEMINEAVRLLKPNGKIIVLTPSGQKSVASSLFEVWRYPFSIRNFTFIIWKIATHRAAGKWKNEKWVEKYAIENKLNYSVSTVFNNNAIVETIAFT